MEEEVNILVISNGARSRKQQMHNLELITKIIESGDREINIEIKDVSIIQEMKELRDNHPIIDQLLCKHGFKRQKPILWID